MHSVKRTVVRTRVVIVASAFCLLTGSGLWAQATQATPAAADQSSAQDVVTLDKFTVTTEHEGYQAVDTLGGARIRTKLSDTPSSLSVVTQKFLQDTGVTNAQDLLVYTTNTEVGGLNGNYSGVTSRGAGVAGNAESGRLINPSSVNRSRGISAMDNTRNYFSSEIPWDSFDISRIDISRGPNSFLFGVGSPSGISNYSTNEAAFKDQGSVEQHVGSFGTTRSTLDYNKVLLPKELAARIDVVNDNTQYEQKPAYSHTERVYGSVRYEPKALSTDNNHLKITLNAETGQVNSNNPRELAPLDFITGYFTSGINKAGYDPFVYAGTAQTGGYYSTLSPWVNGGDYHYAWPSSTPTYKYDSTTGTLISAYETMNGITGANGSGISSASYPQTVSLYTTGYANHAIAANAANTALFPGAHAGTVTYADKSLTDSSIFDFYKKLIDGKNKREWQRFGGFNFTVEDSMFNDRVAVQATVDHQDYTQGQEGAMLGYSTPWVSVDLNSYDIKTPTWYSGATVNANEGRPFVAGDFGSGNHSTHYVHDNYQVTASGSLRADDFMKKGPLTDILGHHEITALAGQYITKQEDKAWTLYRTDEAYSLLTSTTGSTSNTGLQWVEYLGPTLKNASTASGANLNAATTLIAPQTGVTQYFNNTYTSSTPSTATWTSPRDGTVSTQSDNLANYKGWSNTPTTVLNTTSNMDQLYTSGTKSETVLKSASFMYQGFLWDETIIPEFGWRRDTVRQRSGAAPIDGSTNVASMNYGITSSDAVVNTESKSYGLTLHLPKKYRENLPLATDVSVYYFHGANETPKLRYAFDGSQLPSETGKTDDFGVQIDTLNGRATLRLTVFKTIDKNTAASSGAADPLGNNGYYMYLLPAWGAADAAATGRYYATGYDGGSFTVDGTNGALDASRKAAVAAWQSNIGTVFPQKFFDAYGLGVNVSALQTGNWSNIYNNSSKYYPWDIVNSNGGKINGTFPIVNQDLESKGYELEGTIRPITNWDITFNASKVNAFQTALGAATSNFVIAEHDFFNGAAGNLPLWGYWGSSTGTTLKQYFNQYIWSAYLLQAAQNGQPQPELRTWSFKFTTNYRFDKGALKGVNVGGGYRWSSKPILGYGIKQTSDIDADGNKMWIMDVTQPRYGKIDEHVDAWIGYEHRLTAKINWRVQLNIKNVGEKPHLVPVSVEPDGSWAAQRIAMGQTWDLSTKLSF